MHKMHYLKKIDMYEANNKFYTYSLCLEIYQIILNLVVNQYRNLIIILSSSV